MRFSPGYNLGRYVIEALLGEGGMGEVYRATDTRLQRKVALKVLHLRSNQDERVWKQAVARMLHEARAAAAMNHPGTVAIYDVGEDEDTPFIAMELVEGRSLRTIVNESLPLGLRLHILLDLALVLAAAHRERLVHRDIKPENVMLRDDGTVKLLDFGIARKVAVGTSPSASTVESNPLKDTFFGTPMYMAPEQVCGEEIDARTDQYAWGVVAYELISGKLPHQTDKGVVSIVASIVNAPMPPLPGVPEGVEAIVRRALEKLPKDRFPSMDRVVEELAPFVIAEADGIARRSTTENRTSVRSIRSGDLAATSALHPQRRWAPLLVALGAVAVAAVVLVASFEGAFSGASRAVVVAALGFRNAKSAPTPITALPLPKSDVPEAVIAYREGVQAIRDASWDMAYVAFDRARKADPSMPAAQMRFAFTAMYTDVYATREAYRKALLLRSALGERDQRLLDALEPFVQRDPADPNEATRRLALLSARFPGDVEITSWLASLITASNPEIGLATAERCIALDMKHADCWQVKSRALLELRRTDEAHAAVNRCLELVPGAVDCLANRAAFARAAGRCEELLDTVRTWVAKDPESGRSHQALAVALYAIGAPESAVQRAVDQAAYWHRASGKSINADFLEVDFALAIGDFSRAERRLSEIAGAAEEPMAADRQWEIQGRWLELYRETGRDMEAGKAAAAIRKQRDAFARRSWAPVWVDRTTDLLSAELRAGLISRNTFDAERATWLHRFDEAEPATRLAAWYSGYAFPARTLEEAKEAFAAMPALAPLPHTVPPFRVIRTEAAVGKLHMLVGDARAALPHLTAAAEDCGVLEGAISHFRTMVSLGAAREALGDRDGACKAYRAVLARFRHAKNSISAKTTLQRVQALECGPEDEP